MERTAKQRDTQRQRDARFFATIVNVARALPTFQGTILALCKEHLNEVHKQAALYENKYRSGGLVNQTFPDFVKAVGDRHRTRERYYVGTDVVSPASMVDQVDSVAKWVE